MSQTRQLAAIMFTDIVGYTALMGKDESRAFELLEKNRALQKPIITQFNGLWIKELGDGVMASFNTVSDAVNAAVQIQQACNKAKDFKLRIGIHLGEVVFENNDVFGDGVNIASRIQAVAHPGSVFVSESVHNNVINKKDVVTVFVKKQILKNVKQPVKIYQVIAEGIVTAPRDRIKSNIRSNKLALFIILALAICLVAGYFILGFPGKETHLNNFEKSIAVLPFADMSAAKDQEYLGDGLAEEIINSISIIKDLKVIGRTSSFQFKEKGLDAQTIGKKLGVNIILEGSIRKSGNNLRIISQLIRVRDNSTIWSQRFDKELKDIFAIQDSIANKIVEKLKLTLSDSEKPRLTKKETNPEVYSLYLKGLHTYKEEEWQKSLDYHLSAVKLDSMFAPSYAFAALSKTWIINRTHGYSDFNAILEAKQLAERAIRLDPNLAEGYSALALLAWTIQRQFDQAKLNFEKSIALNSSASLLKNRYAYFLLWMGDFDKALQLGLDAINTDPADYNGYIIAANALRNKKKFKEAEKHIAEGQKLFPDHFAFENQRIQVKFSSGDYAASIQMINQAMKKNPPRRLDDLLGLLSVAYHKTGKLEESRKILKQLKEKAPTPNANIEFNLARIYTQYELKDSAFVHLQRSFDRLETEFRMLKIDPLLEPLRDDPRYKDLYRLYGFDKYQ